MKKLMLSEKVKLLGIKNFKGEDKLVDYYIVLPNYEKIYAFSKTYTHNTYDMCKAGIRINELLTKKSVDLAVMRLVGYTKFMLPYLIEYYDLPRQTA